jgi:cell division protein FtsB
MVAGEAALGGAQAALEEWQRVQAQIEEINQQIQQNVDEIRFKNDFVQRLRTDISALIRERAQLRGR